MDIAVIGHICKDCIVPTGDAAPKTTQFGGIIYAVAALSGLSGPKDTIHPICGVGESDFDPLVKILSGFDGVSTDGIFPLKSATNEVTLIYGDRGNRIECSENIAPPIPFDRIKPYLSTDGILVNMVSGSDITLETLDVIRMEVRDARTPIHFDFHSLTLGIQKKGKRFRRPLIDWRRWAFMLQSIQLSEVEAKGLTSERYDETTLINQMMPLMVHTLLLTRGADGVTAIVQDSHKNLTRTEIDGINVKMKDTTGCGDVFGATYLRTLVDTQDPLAAARKANEVAALHASLSAKDKYQRLYQKLVKSRAEPQDSSGG
jgi:sugar/nucleoside kinase (ribokinase family)